MKTNDAPPGSDAPRSGNYSSVERVLRASYEASPLMMGTVELLADGDLLHLYDNSATSRFFGSPPGTTAGRKARELGVPERTIALWRARYDEAIARSTPVSFEYMHEAGAGASRRLLAVTVTPLDMAGPHGAPTCCYIAEDVSERRRAETALRQVIESTHDGVIVLSRDWRLELMNSNAIALLACGADFSGRNMWEAFPEAVGGTFWRACQCCMTERLPTEAEEHYPQLARTFAARAFPLDDEGITVFFQDVTATRKAEVALARSNEEARVAAERVQLALAAGAIVGTWDWELPTDRITVDERFAESFGIDPALGRTGLTLEQVIATVHPDDLPGLRAAIEEGISRGGRYSHEYRVRRRDGHYRWIEANGRVDHAPDGTPARFPGVLLDIERRRALEDERDRATQLLRAFIEAVPGMVYAKDRDGRMLVANRGVTELVGKPTGSYIGKTDLEFLDHKGQAEAVMANDRRIMQGGQAETLEEEVSFPDGRRAVWLSTKAPFRDAGRRVIGLIGSSVDITARKNSEAALRQRTQELADAQLRLEVALSAARMGVWDWSPDTGEARWNPQMFEILGLEPCPDDQVRGDTFIAMVHPDDRPRLDAALARALADGTEFKMEVRIRRGDGELRWVLGHGRLLFDPLGRPERMVGVNWDITERKVAERALLEADRHRNEFLAMLGHELRNPLAPIVNAVQLLELGGSQLERRSAAVQIIRRQAEHMARLVDDLLEVSRVTQGRIELRKENILVASPVFSAVETVRPLVRERQQTLEVDVAQDMDLVADQARLTQILANLLNNASKYTQPGGRITVRAHAVGDDEDSVEIVVADNGPGIDQDLLPRVFDLFSQAASTLDRSRGGLGLGLSLVKRLVELHGGSVRAESAGPGQGATFTVRLPRVERRQAPRGRAAGLPGRALAPTSILLVDDNVDAVNTLAMMLEADGHRVERAHDGEEALVLARRFAPRVVLLDIGLPRLDGWEVARRLRAEPATAGVVLIALSGYGQTEDRERSRAAGFDDHLLKPVDLAAVYGAAGAHLHRFNADARRR